MLLFGQGAIDLYLPSLPSLAHKLDATPFLSQLTITLYFLAYSLVQPIAAPFSERFGRRPLLLFGVALFWLGSLGAALAPSIGFLLFARLVQGFGLGNCSILSRALLRDLFEGRELARRLSYVAMTWGSIPLIAPAIGGYLEVGFGWRSSFWIFVILSFVAFLFYLFCVPETKAREGRQPLHMGKIFSHYLHILTHRIFLSYLVIQVFAYASIVAYITASPWLLQGLYHLSPVAYGWSMLFVGAGFMIGSFANSFFVHRWGVQKTLRLASWAILPFAGWLLVSAFLPPMHFLLLILPIFFLEFVLAHLFSNAMGGAMHPFALIAASASAVIGSANSLGGATSSWIVAWFPEGTLLPFALFICLLVGSIFCFIHFLVSKE